jgi:hypothetical protein
MVILVFKVQNIVFYEASCTRTAFCFTRHSRKAKGLCLGQVKHGYFTLEFNLIYD